MGNHFYSRLARTNLKSNKRLYFPYILTCIGSVAMFYIICFLASNSGLDNMKGGMQMKVILIFGAIVIAIFITIFLFYTNSFLIKRRKKEFGLFNILGMEKRHIGRVMAYETLYIALQGLFFGLAFGVLLSKLMMLLLVWMMHYEISFQFTISIIGVIASLILFTGIFFAILLKNLRQVHSAKPAELLRGGSMGEKEPKTKWILTIVGVLTLAAGYYIAITTESPLQAIGLFFVAVVLVIIGTYCLFVAGSITFLKALRRNKSYYYKTNHFTAVSGMIYRMKQNAVGLSNICILSTMVLVMVSGTVSLFLGTDDAIRNQYPRNINFYGVSVPSKSAETIVDTVTATLKNMAVDAQGLIKYRYIDYTLSRSGDSFTFPGSSDANSAGYFMTIDDYNSLEGTDIALAEDEIIVCTSNSVAAGWDTVSFGGREYSVTSTSQSVKTMEAYSLMYSELYCFIFPDEQSIEDTCDALSSDAGAESAWAGMALYLGFDVTETGQGQDDIAAGVNTAIENTSGLEYDSLYYSTSSEAELSFYAMYGGLFFLGVFLGTMFIMATVLIMYYKQVSEGYDDKQRFEIMQNIGMSRAEVKRSIRSQVLTVFFLPLTCAVIHVAVAFPMIRRLLLVMNFTDVTMYLLCTLGTILIFSLLYALVYSLTAKTYYKIVQQ